MQALEAGQAKAVGVANYDKSQLEEIATAGLPLPAVNQIPIHLFRSSTQQETIAYCQANGITVNSYSPLGIPDWHAFPTKWVVCSGRWLGVCRGMMRAVEAG